AANTVTLPKGAAATCTVTVTDTSGGAGSSLLGPVTFATDGGGTFSAPSCTLTALGATGSSNSCSLTFNTTTAGSFTITASYPGDANYVATSGTFAIDILDTCNSFTAKLEGQSAGSSLWGISSNLS